MKTANIYYVYEHWRPDRDVCFYVGKGHRRRSGQMTGRNRHHINVQKKLARLGMCVEVRMVASGLSEHDAFFLEIERIAFWRSMDVGLTNKSSGGESSATGNKHTPEWKANHTKRMLENNPFKGRTHTPETLAQIQVSRAGFRHTDQSKKKISASQTGKKMPPSYSEKLRGRMMGHKIWLGKKHKPETIEKMRAARTAYWAAKHAASGETK